ncbi:hypothetical protein MJO29_016077 [Puccinia striiformis f. sp. tritici]|nr:hypothetical protein MJO29_016077 [Puccinia striiformis f. sp. tritici]
MELAEFDAPTWPKIFFHTRALGHLRTPSDLVSTGDFSPKLRTDRLAGPTLPTPFCSCQASHLEISSKSRSYCLYHLVQTNNLTHYDPYNSSEGNRPQSFLLPYTMGAIIGGKDSPLTGCTGLGDSYGSRSYRSNPLAYLHTHTPLPEAV